MARWDGRGVVAQWEQTRIATSKVRFIALGTVMGSTHPYRLPTSPPPPTIPVIGVPEPGQIFGRTGRKIKEQKAPFF
jgi:hypothetical protein